MLKAFLEHPDRPKGTLRYHELQGFLFAVVSSPEMVKPSEWLPVVFAGQEAEYSSLEEANAALGQLMVLYNSINACAMDTHQPLPDDCAFRKALMSNFDDDAPIAQWSRGFGQGHDWLEEVWDAYLPEKLDEDVGGMLMTLTFFASRDLATAYLKETGRKDLRRMAGQIVEIFPKAAGEYARLGRSIEKVLREQAASTPAPVRSAKIGRNDPCPCGSGRKYKRCHGGH